MGQQVIKKSKSNRTQGKRKNIEKFFLIDPKSDELTFIKKDKIKVWTCVCSNRLGWSKVRGEISIESE